MAARRGKSQARRNQGNGGLPGWAWGVIGLLVGIALILAVPTLLKSDGDGFFRPRPNPDAQPEPVAIEDDVVAPDDAGAAPRDNPKAADEPAAGGSKRADYDFYTLLPGKEVALSDAELAATERVEKQRAAQTEAATTATATTAPVTGPLPPPVAGSEPATPATTPTAVATPTAKPTAAVAAPAGDNTRYLLQAGAFQASGQAEELKARIALLGLGARVESASIGGKTVYRVRMGPYGTAGELAEAKRKLATGGLPGMAIKVQ
jgi:cell division protein FtsN